MLAERRSKFGQYDTSLTQRSGIFGMQTKGDIRRSNEILMDIAATDDEIFIELKKLFDYRTNQLNYRRFQQKQSDSTLKELEKSRNAFMQTITRLQNKNESLQVQLINQKADHKKWQGVLIAIIVLMLASILLLLLSRKKRKA
ncbi:hypothetical protein ACFQZX_10575 [Mucilaginibacter litoreus]|uniref:Four helix bundle sensory module for signal transduction n=1 Tax=Mucilaginibacter litoreus TaxID=1048221 RepID=A0ABW3ASX9_9SPHI